MIWLIAVLSALFVAAGIVKFVPKQVAKDATRWGLPIRFIQAVGVVELLLAGLLWVPATWPWPALGLLVLMGGAVGLQVEGRRWNEVWHPLATAGLLVWLLVAP